MTSVFKSLGLRPPVPCFPFSLFPSNSSSWDTLHSTELHLHHFMMIPLLLLIICITSVLLLLKFYYSIIKIETQSSVVDKSHGTTMHRAIMLNDLPDLILDTILERLPPDGLCRMGAVSTFLREKCISDHLWDRHMKFKWGRIIGPAAYQEWQRHVKAINDPILVTKRKGLVHHIVHKLPFCSRITRDTMLRSTLPVDSILAAYLALENGTFWFPAQIYNRTNGHADYSLSCYDAMLCYDHRTDTFQARYPAYGTLDVPTEKDVTWDRLRASPVNTRPYDLFRPDSLKMLHPGDHLEIQWRRNKELAYGWWYGVVGHLDSCNGGEANCYCTTSDILVLEFNQYSPDSRWRKTLINRRDHTEKGNEYIGFYGGIRKLESCDEILTWLQLSLEQVLEGL